MPDGFEPGRTLGSLKIQSAHAVEFSKTAAPSPGEGDSFAERRAQTLRSRQAGTRRV